MKVEIIEKETGKVIASPELSGMLSLTMPNYDLKRREYEREAWRCAVADGVVQDQDHDKYKFRLYQKEE